MVIPQHYPMFVSLKKRVCLVVGGGSVGERKVRLLLQYGAAIRIIAEDLTPWLQAQCEAGSVVLVGNSYTADCMQDVHIVFAATSDFALNRHIAEDAEKRGLWCNMATEPAVGSFIVPSVLQRGALTIAVSTGGASPATAVRIRQQLEREFGSEWVIMLHLMEILRTAIQAKGEESAQNQELFRRVAELPLPEWIQHGEKNKVVLALSDICHPWVTPLELEQIWDEAWKQFS